MLSDLMEERHGRNCSTKEGTRRIGPSRRIQPHNTEHHLPTTPPPDKSISQTIDESPCILLHGSPLNTPAKVHFGLLPPVDIDHSTTLKKKAKENDEALKKSRKNSFQRAVDVNKETLENTKKNSGYSTIDIVKELVRVDGPRPPSPSLSSSSSSAKGAKKKVKNKQLEHETSNASKIKFIENPSHAKLDQSIILNEPPFYDTFFPLKSILKAKKEWNVDQGVVDDKAQPIEKVTVKKIIYTDDDPNGFVDMLPAEPTKPSHCAAVKPQRLKGPARRIVR